MVAVTLLMFVIGIQALVYSKIVSEIFMSKACYHLNTLENSKDGITLMASTSRTPHSHLACGDTE